MRFFTLDGLYDDLMQATLQLETKSLQTPLVNVWAALVILYVWEALIQTLHLAQGPTPLPHNVLPFYLLFAAKEE